MPGFLPLLLCLLHLYPSPGFLSLCTYHLTVVRGNLKDKCDYHANTNTINSQAVLPGDDRH